MRPHTYATPATFKQSLEQRLKDSSKGGVDITRRRQLLVFDRFLARVVATLGDAATLKGGLALEQTFTFRATHALPAFVSAPLESWTVPYAAMAQEDELAWATLDEVTKAVRTFLDPVLAGGLDGTWLCGDWYWRLE